MKDSLISLFLDNELDLVEKKEFVDAIAEDSIFYKETCSLLEQEKMLRTSMVKVTPPAPALPLRHQFLLMLPSWRPAMAGFAVALVLLATLFNLHTPPVPVTVAQTAHRFVIYLPDVGEASVIGSFTNWSPIPMERMGNSGYWALDLALQPGEHRYSYVVGNDTRFADPTIPEREYDDFGGENSIINIATTI